MFNKKTGALLLIMSLVLLSCAQKQEGAQQEEKQKALPHTLLLKSWLPHSIYNIPAHKIAKAKYPAIDMHAHDYATTAKEVAKRARIYDEVGLQKSVVFTGVTGPKFDSLYSLYSVYPDKFMVFCGIDFSGYDKQGWQQKAVDELIRDVSEGAKGVGEIHDKGAGLSSGGITAKGLHPDDPEMDPIWDACARLGIPVSLHISDPIWMYEPMDSTNDGLMRSWTWRISKDDGAKTHEQMMQILENTLKRHPNTTFIICHLGNLAFDLSKLGALFDKYPGFYADISARFSEFSTIPRYAAQFFTKYQDRLVYGTDYGWEVWKPKNAYGQTEPSLQQMYSMTFRVLETTDDHFYLTTLLGYKWPLYGLGLDDDVLKDIYRNNALKIFKKERVND